MKKKSSHEQGLFMCTFSHVKTVHHFWSPVTFLKKNLFKQYFTYTATTRRFMILSVFCIIKECMFCCVDIYGIFLFFLFQLCVKNKALQSILLVRDVSKLEAMTVVDEVFDKCYNDTEPLGRRCFKDFRRSKRALEEARNYYNFD